MTADAAAVAARVRNAGAVFVGPFAPVSLGDYAAGSNHVLPTAGCACHSAACRSSPSCAASTSSTTTRPPCVTSPATSSRSPRPRTSRPTARPSRRASRGAGDLPRPGRQRGQRLRPDLRGRTPYGAPQLDVPVRLNTNENSYPVPAGGRGRHRRGLAEVARPQPLPRPRVHRPAQGPGRHTSARSGVTVTPEQVWAGNGSNEVLSHIVQAFGGPGRVALGFTPGLLDAPDHQRDARHDVGRRPPTGRGPSPFDLTAGRRRPSRSGSTSPTSSSSARPTTRPAPRCGSTSSRPSTRPRPTRRRRRRGVRRVRPAGHAERTDPARRAARGSSSPAR